MTYLLSQLIVPGSVDPAIPAFLGAAQSLAQKAAGFRSSEEFPQKAPGVGKALGKSFDKKWSQLTKMPGGRPPKHAFTLELFEKFVGVLITFKEKGERAIQEDEIEHLKRLFDSYSDAMNAYAGSRGKRALLHRVQKVTLIGEADKIFRGPPPTDPREFDLVARKNIFDVRGTGSCDDAVRNAAALLCFLENSTEAPKLVPHRNALMASIINQGIWAAYQGGDNWGMGYLLDIAQRLRKEGLKVFARNRFRQVANYYRPGAGYGLRYLADFDKDKSGEILGKFPCAGGAYHNAANDALKMGAQLHQPLSELRGLSPFSALRRAISEDQDSCGVEGMIIGFGSLAVAHAKAGEFDEAHNAIGEGRTVIEVQAKAGQAPYAKAIFELRQAEVELLYTKASRDAARVFLG
jgi:hypothetical protein